MATMADPDTYPRSATSEPRQTPNDFHKIDREALDRALEMTLAETDLGRPEQVRAMLAEDGWFYAASFCAYHRQCISLNLASYSTPPCHVDEDDIRPHRGDDKALTLLKQMLRHRVSLYEPEPLKAIEARKTKPRKR
jgi:hypothetical protein